MSVFHNNILGGAAGQTGGAADAAAGPIKSLRFDKVGPLNGSQAGHLKGFTPSSAGNRRTWTWAAWVKLGKLNDTLLLFSAGDGAFDVDHIKFNGDKIEILSAISSINWRYQTTALYRDPSSWYHITVAVDTTNSTASDRVKIYVNGTRVEDFNVSTAPSQNYQNNISSTKQHAVGYDVGNIGYTFAGYMADVFFIDGSQLDPTSFGAFDDNGVWQAAAYSGTYGTNGFHLLDFANEPTIGHDSSGNNNDFTANNLTASTLDYSTSGGAVTNAGNALDGNDNTYSQTSTGENSTYTFSPAISVSSGRIDLRARNHPSLTYKAVTNAGTITFTLQGTWPGSGHVDYPGWYYISNASVTSISQIILETSDSSVNWTFTGFQVAGSPSSVGDQFVTAVPSSDLDILFDVPTNGTQTDTGAGGEVSGNYATLNPMQKGSNVTLSNGNLVYTSNANATHANKLTFSTIGVSSGKWYAEATCTAKNDNFYIGVMGNVSQNFNTPYTTSLGFYATGWGYWSDGDIYNNGSVIDSGPASVGVDDVVGVALDVDNRTVTFYKNGVKQGSTATSLTADATWMFAVGAYKDSTIAWNFGQRAWDYSAPANHKPLCSALLDTPTVPDGSTAFDIDLYTGTGTTHERSEFSFSPNLVWIKQRNTTRNNLLFDTIRGANNFAVSNSSGAPGTGSGMVTSFDNDGFTLGNSDDVNQSSGTFVAWCWDAGTGSPVSNTDGSVTSQVRANQSAGISVVTFTNPSSGAFTVGHGLNAQVALVFMKHRNRAGDWLTWFSGFSKSEYLVLNSTAAKASATEVWGSSAPGSSTFGGKIGVSALAGDTDVAYCFAPVSGYSAFGSYTGNGSSTDGPFVYTGFRPSLIILKPSSGTGNWTLFDTTRDTYNVANSRLHANLTDAEATSNTIDILSNGFKIYRAGLTENSNGVTYIYAAFAENPFQANGGLAR